MTNERAIEILKNEIHHCREHLGWKDMAPEYYQELGELVEAMEMAVEKMEAERKEGRWIRKSTWMWTCSCCGKDDAYAYTADDACEPTVLQDFFCPNCGTKMGGEQK